MIIPLTVLFSATGNIRIIVYYIWTNYTRKSHGVFVVLYDTKTRDDIWLLPYLYSILA